MKITVIGGHGKIAMKLHPLLKEAGHEVRAVIRKKEQMDAIREAGAEPVLCDVEQEDDISQAVGNVDAVVFAAGAGPGSGAERKWTVDRDAALKLMAACKANGISRYVMISAMKVEIPRGNEVFQVYQKAKAEADAALRESSLDYTIVRPGRLTDESPTGKISAAFDLERGEIPRADVAAVVAAVLDEPATIRKQFDLISGDTPVEDAIKQIS